MKTMSILPRRKHPDLVSRAFRHGVLLATLLLATLAGGRGIGAADAVNVHPRSDHASPQGPASPRAQAAAEAPELFVPAIYGSAGRTSLHLQGLGGRPSGVLLIVLPGPEEVGVASSGAPVSVLCRRMGEATAVTFAANAFPAREVSIAAFSLSEAPPLPGSPFIESPYHTACALANALVDDSAAYAAFKRSFEGEGLWKGLSWSEGWGNPMAGLARFAVDGHGEAIRHVVMAASAARPQVAASPEQPPPGTDTPNPTETPLPTPTAPPVRPMMAFQVPGPTTVTYALPAPLLVDPDVMTHVTLLNAGSHAAQVAFEFVQGGQRLPALCDGGGRVEIPLGGTLRPCIRSLTDGATLIILASSQDRPRLAIGAFLNQDSRGAAAAAYAADLPSSPRLAVPLPYPAAADLSIRLQVTNPGDRAAIVELAWVDEKGIDIDRRRQPLEAWETRMIDLGGSPVPVLPSKGKILARSLPVGPAGPGPETEDGQPISAVLLLVSTVVEGRLPVASDLAALPLQPVGPGASDLRGGLLAVPLLRNTDDGISELSILDAAEGDGFTDLQLAVFDANGLVDVSCERVDHGRVLAWDLRRLGTLPPGFRGAGVVSAVYWEHARLAPGQAEPGPDLAAVVAARSVGSERPLEAAAESLPRFPVGSVPEPLLPHLPPCPGVPTRRPPATATPKAGPPTVTPQPSVSSLPPPRDTPTAPASPLPPPSDTPAPRLRPAYLPAVLAGADPWPLGLVLALDVLPPGSARQAGAAAIPLDAARPLGQMALGLLRPREDAAALVTYDLAASVLSRGRPADVAHALASLAAADIQATARPDLGLAAAELAVRDLRDQGGVRRGAVLLFIDGATTEAELARAEARAARLRTAGLPIFALGFPSSHGGRPALERLTGSPAQVAWILPGEGGLVEAQEALDRWAADGWTATSSGEPPARR